MKTQVVDCGYSLPIQELLHTLYAIVKSRHEKLNVLKCVGAKQMHLLCQEGNCAKPPTVYFNSPESCKNSFISFKHAQTDACSQTHTHTDKQEYGDTHMCTYLYTDIHIHTHTHTHLIQTDTFCKKNTYTLHTHTHTHIHLNRHIPSLKKHMHTAHTHRLSGSFFIHLAGGR